MRTMISIVIGVILLEGFGVIYVKYDIPRSGTSAPLESLNPAATGNATATYTLAQVASHKTSSDCWTTINGGVYNVTAWIDQHPGGADAIISLCGIDGSDAFNGQHGEQRRPASELASFKIGTLAGASINTTSGTKSVPAVYDDDGDE